MIITDNIIKYTMDKTQLTSDFLVLFGGINFAVAYNFDTLDKHVTLDLAVGTFTIYLIINLRRLLIEGKALFQLFVTTPIKNLINLFKNKNKK